MSVVHLERFVHGAPFGVRLRDVVTGRPVVDHVSVQLVPRSGPVATAVRTPSGVFAAHRLPSLRRWELRDVSPDGLEEVVDVHPVSFRVEVLDGSGSFHSFFVQADLPSDGLLAPACGSPPASLPDDTSRYLPLFSLPARPVPAATAVVRARLIRAADHRPAAYAALEVVPAPGADPVRGIADRRGEVVVMFPYPAPPGFAGSPPGGTKRPLAKTTWPVAVQAYLPLVDTTLEMFELPDLCTFLDQSPTSLTTAGSPPQELREETLEYGRELVLRSSPGDPALLVGA